MIFWPPRELAEWLVEMDLASFHVFSSWLQLRQLAMHRLELPFLSGNELGAALGLQVPALGPSRSPISGVRTALEGLQAHRDQAMLPARQVAFLSACWGQRHAARLGLWLEAVHRAQIQKHTAIMCHDTAALAACKARHRWPHLCADARDWPKSLLSKLVGLALCLQLGLDVMWLDSDAVVLGDPRPFLVPIRTASEEVEEQPELLFSVEPDSWNCVNAGVFFARSTQRVLRYFGFWIALFLMRPFSFDQAVLSMLLGLVKKMDFADFAAREQLLDVESPRPRALGTLQTPVWGALDGRAAFGMTAQIVTGGIQPGATASLVIMHLLESWPNSSIPWPIYGDVPDIVLEILAGLGGAEHDMSRAMTLIRRSEQAFPQGRRDCRTSYIHGR